MTPRATETCGMSGPCLHLHDFMLCTNPHYHDGFIVWGSMKMRVCVFCGESLPDVVLRAWRWATYRPPEPLLTSSTVGEMSAWADDDEDHA